MGAGNRDPHPTPGNCWAPCVSGESGRAPRHPRKQSGEWPPTASGSKNAASPLPPHFRLSLFILFAYKPPCVVFEMTPKSKQRTDGKPAWCPVLWLHGVRATPARVKKGKSATTQPRCHCTTQPDPRSHHAMTLSTLHSTPGQGHLGRNRTSRPHDCRHQRGLPELSTASACSRPGFKPQHRTVSRE